VGRGLRPGCRPERAGLTPPADLLAVSEERAVLMADELISGGNSIQRPSETSRACSDQATSRSREEPAVYR